MSLLLHVGLALCLSCTKYLLNRRPVNEQDVIFTFNYLTNVGKKTSVKRELTGALDQEIEAQGASFNSGSQLR